MKKVITIASITIIGLLFSTTSYAGCSQSNGITQCQQTINVPSGGSANAINVTLSCGGSKKILGYVFGWPRTKPAGYPESGIAPITTSGTNTGFTKTSWSLTVSNGAGSSRPAYPLSITTVCK